ncbi:MAG: F0F1 ATP synthase subunit B [Gemmatimonadales bacterium]|nr:F0F1 ATP synthase subunit B [Gemmatimonadales bacterium]
MVMLALLTAAAEGAEGGGKGPFAVNPGLTIWTWVVFIALFLLLRKFVWPQILKATEEREQTITRQLAEAKTMHAEAQAALAEQRKLLDEARGASQKLLADARTMAEKERALAVEKTKAEQDEMIARARREIQGERERAVAELRREAVELSLAAASKVVGQRLEAEQDRKIVADYLASLGQGK